MKHFALALIISSGVSTSSMGLAQSFSDFGGHLPAVLQIHEGFTPKRVTTTCKVKMSILEDAQQFKISNGEFQCGETSWNESITLFKRNGVLYDRLGVAVGNLYDSGTLQFSSSQGTQFEYQEKTFDSHCNLMGSTKRSLPLAKTVIYAIQPAQSGYNLSVEIYWEKPVAKRASSSCLGAEAWGKVEDAGRSRGVLKTL